jgi:MerR family transcriptional regulator, heat shock protein HspR
VVRGDPMFDEPLYVISVAARLAAMHPQTLRMYERRGLIVPRRLANNRRLYSQQDVEHLRRIQELTETGLNLTGVERVIALEQTVARMQLEMERMQAQLDAAAARLRREVELAQRAQRRDLVPVQRGMLQVRSKRRS